MVKIIIVNESDDIIGYKERDSLKKEDIYRVSALWITNSKKEILLAKRHHTKSHHPGMWGPAVAGTVEEEETYESNIIKEIEEELGLVGVKLKLGPKMKIENEYIHFTQWFTLIIDKEIDKFLIPLDEVEEIKWFSKDQLLLELESFSNKFLPSMRKYLELF